MTQSFPQTAPGLFSTAEAAAVPPPIAAAPFWTAQATPKASASGWLLDPDASTTLAGALPRVGAGLGLSALYGVALGTRAGGSSVFEHALGVPAAVLFVMLFGLPALYIVLAFLKTPLGVGDALSATTRATVTTGIVLAGLAPAVALYVVTSDATIAAGVSAALGLALAGFLGLRQLIGTMSRQLKGTDTATFGLATIVSYGFALFAAVLGARVWMLTLPLLGGGL